MLIGITGTLGAGKGTLTDYLVKNRDFKHFAVSDTFLAGEAIKRGLEPNRMNRHNIANEYRALGPTKLMEAVYEMAQPVIEAGHHAVVEPQHTVAEVEFIKSMGGIVFAVDADIYNRYARIQKRGGTKDDVTFEDFKKVEDLEMTSTNPNENNLRASVDAADHTIMNDGTLEELQVQIEEVLLKVEKKGI